ncbi:hypothetical protein ENBRE01_1698 [Enteropsectra breve]|nr:hypothetical protein ENBRE01_1521 [Enteropsectra breve]KAI5150770.1 hypothetical protein ENBRE01_1698 [Enteropsectra breve]
MRIDTRRCFVAMLSEAVRCHSASTNKAVKPVLNPKSSFYKKLPDIEESSITSFDQLEPSGISTDPLKMDEKEQDEANGFDSNEKLYGSAPCPLKCLTNKHKNCFLNAALQTLACNKPLVNILSKNKLSIQSKSDAFPICNFLIDFLEDYSCSGKKYVEMEKYTGRIYNLLQVTADQTDNIGFFSILLKVLSTELEKDLCSYRDVLKQVSFKMLLFDENKEMRYDCGKLNEADNAPLNLKNKLAFLNENGLAEQRIGNSFEITPSDQTLEDLSDSISKDLEEKREKLHQEAHDTLTRNNIDVKFEYEVEMPNTLFLYNKRIINPASDAFCLRGGASPDEVLSVEKNKDEKKSNSANVELKTENQDNILANSTTKDTQPDISKSKSIVEDTALQTKVKVVDEFVSEKNDVLPENKDGKVFDFGSEAATTESNPVNIQQPYASSNEAPQNTPAIASGNASENDNDDPLATQQHASSSSLLASSELNTETKDENHLTAPKSLDEDEPVHNNMNNTIKRIEKSLQQDQINNLDEEDTLLQKALDTFDFEELKTLTENLIEAAEENCAELYERLKNTEKMMIKKYGESSLANKTDKLKEKKAEYEKNIKTLKEENNDLDEQILKEMQKIEAAKRIKKECEMELGAAKRKKENLQTIKKYSEYSKMRFKKLLNFYESKDVRNSEVKKHVSSNDNQHTETNPHKSFKSFEIREFTTFTVQNKTFIYRVVAIINHIGKNCDDGHFNSVVWRNGNYYLIENEEIFKLHDGLEQFKDVIDSNAVYVMLEKV